MQLYLFLAGDKLKVMLFDCFYLAGVCADVTCQNQGICAAKGNTYVCLCADGFVGLHCETGK